MANHTLFGGGGFREYGPKRIQGTSYGMCVGLGSGAGILMELKGHSFSLVHFTGNYLSSYLLVKWILSTHYSLILVEIVSNAQHKSNWVA